MMTQTEKDKAERKVQIAIDKIMDLKSDYDISDDNFFFCDRVLDVLNELESRIMSEETK